MVSVFGNDIDAYYDKLLQGENGISLIDKFDASTFSARFAGQIQNFSSKGYIDGKNDRRLDDCWRYCLVSGKRALEAANLGPEVLENVSGFLLEKQSNKIKNSISSVFWFDPICLELVGISVRMHRHLVKITKLQK